ncbi:DUF2087 domain-containing protein [Propionicimonas sp.]|uniref:DUF2087 domain-containing protein n=1 Tax=Propionicimonas sp. TaxID=1955623 RepID=UPI0039E6E208
MDAAEPLDWRAVLALLANADARAALAELADTTRLAEKRRRLALERWQRAGVVTTDPDGNLAVDEARLRATVNAVATKRPAGVERFLAADGTIQAYPSRASDRAELLELVAGRAIAAGEAIGEPELNERLSGFTDDVATLRRFLVDAGFLHRDPDGTGYRR